MVSTKKLASGIGNKPFSLKNLRIITNPNYPYIWLVNIEADWSRPDKRQKFNSTVIKLANRNTLWPNRKDNDIIKLLKGQNNVEFEYILSDKLSEIDFETYMLISSYARANGLRINLKKGEVYKLPKFTKLGYAEED